MSDVKGKAELWSASFVGSIGSTGGRLNPVFVTMGKSGHRPVPYHRYPHRGANSASELETMPYFA